jgi:hypothetical protein
MKYIIIDWAYNHLFKDKLFDSVEDASDFLLDTFPNEDDLQEYYIIKI